MSGVKRWHSPNNLISWEMCAGDRNSAVHMVSLDARCSSDKLRLDTRGAAERTSRDGAMLMSEMSGFSLTQFSNVQFQTFSNEHFIFYFSNMPFSPPLPFSQKSRPPVFV